MRPPAVPLLAYPVALLPHCAVSATAPRPPAHAAKAVNGAARYKVVAYDYGIKTNILRRLASFGCDITVVPADYPAEKVRGPQFFSCRLAEPSGLLACSCLCLPITPPRRWGPGIWCRHPSGVLGGQGAWFFQSPAAACCLQRVYIWASSVNRPAACSQALLQTPSPRVLPSLFAGAGHEP